MEVTHTLISLLDDFLNWTVIGGYDRIGYSVRRMGWDEAEINVDMTGKVIMITGGNAGIGRAAATSLAGLGASVTIVCRNRERGEEACNAIRRETGNQEVFLEVADMSNPDAVQAMAGRFAANHTRLDVLINNAGVLLQEKAFTDNDTEMTFAVNTLGYFQLTRLMLPLLQASAPARVINVTSGGMYTARLQVDDPFFLERTYDGTKAYAESKRAEMVLTRMWAERLEGTGISVNAMHPGWADTKAVRESLPRFHAVTRAILRTPEQGADTIIWLAVNPRLTSEDTGKLFFDRKSRAPYRLASTRETEAERKRLWALCESMVSEKSTHAPVELLPG
jgi:NAD(P)-dependent dehydrogenase (short-subunit alcohol dehydrogenase family)